MKYLVILAFIAIVGSLASALFFMMRGDKALDNKRRSRNMEWSLALRIGFSILLFLCILLAWKLGYIHATGIPPGE